MAWPAAPVRRTCVVLAVVAGLGSSCGSPATVVLVGVQGTTTAALGQLDVEATVGAQTRSLRVPDQPAAPFFLPTNFTLQIPRTLTGTLQVLVTALDTAGRAVASGTGTVQLAVGKVNELTLTIGENGLDGGPADAGADGPVVDAATPDPPTDAAESAPGDLAGTDAGASDAAPDAPIDQAPDGAGDAPAGDGPRDTQGDSASDPASDARDGG
jgi:hypothetical protein